jgi:MFS family permease
MASAVRVLYPALAGSWQMSAGQIGLLYAAIPLGAALGALTSGQLAQTVRPGALMLATTVCVCRHCAVQPDAALGVGRAVPGAVWLAERY